MRETQAESRARARGFVSPEPARSVSFPGMFALNAPPNAPIKAAPLALGFFLAGGATPSAADDPGPVDAPAATLRGKFHVASRASHRRQRNTALFTPHRARTRVVWRPSGRLPIRTARGASRTRRRRARCSGLGLVRG